MASAQRLSMTFDNTPLPDALRQIDHAQNDKRIVFVHNDLEELHTSCSLHRKDVLEAIQEVCKGQPILITETDSHILVEYIQPPMHLLPTVTKIQRQIIEEADGYRIQTNIHGASATQLLAILPRLLVRDGIVYVNGQPIRNLYLNGMSINGLHELDQLESGMIESVRVDERSNAIYLTLRKPKENGYYGQLKAQGNKKKDADNETLNGIWYSKLRKTNFYDKFGWERLHQLDGIEQLCTSPQIAKYYRSEMTTDKNRFNNRLSILHEFTPSQSLGFSYYVAAHQGKGRSIKTDAQNYRNFAGKNRHNEQELTLKYHALFGRRNPSKTEANLLADVFRRQTTSENVSLYGAGVGTEIDEAPSIVMTKMAADLHTPLSDKATLHYGIDYQSLTSSYDPCRFLSNYNGVSMLGLRMNQHGTMLRGDWGLRLKLRYATFDANISPFYLKTNQTMLTEEDDCDKPERQQFEWTGNIRMFIPLGQNHEHTLTLSYRQELDEMPYSAMSPTIRWNDAYNYSTGNTKLSAPFSQQIMFNTSLWHNRLLFTASHTKISGEIYWQSFINSGQTEVFYTKPINLSINRQTKLQLEGNLQPTRHWQFKLLAQWTHRPENETIGGIGYNGYHWQQYYTCISHWSIGREWQMMLDAWYQPTYRRYDRTYHATGSLNAEIKRTFLRNHLQCGLHSCIWGRNRQLDRQIQDYHVNYRYLSPLEQIGISIAWNFSSHRNIKVKAVEGAQQYMDIRDQ